jgi:hypothetical protein
VIGKVTDKIGSLQFIKSHKVGDLKSGIRLGVAHHIPAIGLGDELEGAAYARTPLVLTNFHHLNPDALVHAHDPLAEMTGDWEGQRILRGCY